MFLNFAQWKGLISTWKLYLKKNLIRGNLVILAQKWYALITLDLLSGIFFILHNRRGQEVHENCISCFSRKYLIWGNLIFLGHFLLFDWASLKLSQATVTIGSLNSQDMIFQLKVYVLDVVWILCDVYVWRVNIQKRFVCLCERISLRICCIILYECKGPWMLKTDSLIY